MAKKESQQRSGEQQLIDANQRRARELRNLQRIRLDDPYAKYLLKMIDDVIGSQRPYWDMTRRELLDLTEISQSTYYNRLKKLQDLGFVEAEKLPDTAKIRFRIYHATIEEYISSGNDPGAGFRETEKLFREAESGFRETEQTFRETEKSFRETECTIYSPFLPPSPSSKAEEKRKNFSELFSESELDEGADPLELMLAAGIEWPTGPLKEARSSNCTDEHIRELIAYWHQHREANGWDSKSLRFRIQTALPNLPIDRGWPDPQGQAKKTFAREVRDQQRDEQKRLEADQHQRDQKAAEQVRMQEAAELERLEGACGDLFDTLDESEVSDLARQLGQCQYAAYKRWGRNHSTVRPSLLKLLQRKYQVSHEEAK